MKLKNIFREVMVLMLCGVCFVGCQQKPKQPRIVLGKTPYETRRDANDDNQKPEKEASVAEPMVSSENEAGDTTLLPASRPTIHIKVKGGNASSELEWGKVYEFIVNDTASGGIWMADGLKVWGEKRNVASIKVKVLPSSRSEAVIAYINGGCKIVKKFTVKKPEYHITLKGGDRELEVGKVYEFTVNDNSPELGCWRLDGGMIMMSKENVNTVTVKVLDQRNTNTFCISYLPNGWDVTDKIRNTYKVRPSSGSPSEATPSCGKGGGEKSESSHWDKDNRKRK